MRLSFHAAQPERERRKPVSNPLPACRELQVAAAYHGARVGGDFYDFLQVKSRLLFVLLDIAGKRDEALHIAAVLQDVFAGQGSELFSRSDMNESDALSALLLQMNRSLMATAGGVRCAPAFIACYDQDVGTLTYCNAGHTPALLKDAQGISSLEATGLPLGLFSHTIQDANFSVLQPGAALVLVSKGLVESRSGSHEFGLDRVKQTVGAQAQGDAEDLCQKLLKEVASFSESPTHYGPALHVPGFHHAEERNDITALALMRVPPATHVAVAAS